MSEIGNMEKYEKYKKQMERLKKAMVNKFWLEAVFIEYGVMEDRTKVILKLSGRKEKPKEAFPANGIRRILLAVDLLLLENMVSMASSTQQANW